LEERGVQIVPTCFVWQNQDGEKNVAQVGSICSRASDWSVGTQCMGGFPYGQLCEKRGWDDIVIKPCISAGSLHAKRWVDPWPSLLGSWNTEHFYDGGPCGFRFQLKDGLAEPQAFLELLLQLGDVLVQRFMPEIFQHGERSYMIIDGEVRTRSFSSAALPRFKRLQGKGLRAVGGGTG
jgi:hypothetical protein